MSTFNTAITVDALGQLRAEIKQLQDQAKRMEEDLKATGLHEIDGEWYHANIAHSERKTVNWQKIAKDLGASAVRIAKNTKKTEVITLRITAHKRAA